MFQRTPSSLSKHVFEAQNGIVFFPTITVNFPLLRPVKNTILKRSSLHTKATSGEGGGVVGITFLSDPL